MSILNVVSVSVPSLFAASPSSSAAFPSRNFLPFSPLALPERRSHGKALAAASAAVTDQKVALSNGALFHAFEEIQRDAFVVPAPLTAPLARQGFSDECEAAINDQINVEFNVSYAYHAMYAYFDRDNVAYKGLANFFKGSSVEERRHAEMLMDYQNKRGGRVRFYPVMNPPSEFSHPEKGDALYSMELALSLEKLVNEKLLNLHIIAGKNNDPHLAGYIESEFLSEQVESIKKLSDYVAQLKRIGNGNGVWSFDRMLLN